MYDVWKNSGLVTTIDGNGTRKVNVAVYCRVSTDHEEQINALDNQIEWCRSFLQMHPNLNLVNGCAYSASSKVKDKHEVIEKGFYIDAGKSGLDMEHREAFQKLIKDAKSGKIDLIIVRDNCRFSRNLLDFVMTVRDLKDEKNGVGIYFASNNLFTLDPTGEIILNILAIFAEQESIATSNRIKNNLTTIREQGILFGNGNILGYNLVKEEKGSNRYVINPEQAETVRMIFHLSSEGLGTQKIGEELTRRNRKNSSGQIKWNYQNILRILHNKTYCGYVAYNKVVTPNCITKKRRNLKQEEAQYKKVDESIVPPIISEELFNKCNKKLSQKREEYSSPKTKSGKKTFAKDIYAKKLRCKCGSSFRRDTWHKNSGDNASYGYAYYNVLNNGSKKNYEESGVDTTDLNLCDMTRISSLRLNIQALKVFQGLFDTKELIDDTVEAMKNQTKADKSDIDSQIQSKEKELESLSNRISKYIDLLADGTITKAQYNKKLNETNKAIELLKESIEELKEMKANTREPNIDLNEVRQVLGNVLDFSTSVDMNIIDKYVYRIIVNNPNEFIWQLHFKAITTSNPAFIDLAEHHIDIDYAKSYAKMHNRRIHPSRWNDIDIKVQVVI